MPCHALRIVLAIVCLAVVPTAAGAACDTIANASALLGARAAIDAACDCAAAVKPGAHVKCAKTVVAARIANGLLTKSCKSEALKHAKKSICGRPGAVVCCRIRTNGKTAHKIAKEPAKCVSGPTLTACTSVYDSVPTGCDASGCLQPVCGDGLVEGAETCEPPDSAECDANCQLLVCDPPATSCGNGIVEGGEACEPPGVGACDWSCQTTACAAGGPAEIDVACAAGVATVGAGARGAEYLLAWNDVAYKPVTDIIARRYDADAAPIDATAKIVSAGAPCGGQLSRPSVGSNADGYALAWFGIGPSGFGISYLAIYARPYDATATLGPLDELIRKIPFGMCQSAVFGPTSVAPVPSAGPGVFAATWKDVAACLSGISIADPGGFLLDYADDPPTRTALAIGYDIPAGSFPQPWGDGAASLTTLGTDTLAVMHVHLQDSSPPYESGHFVSGEWLAADGTTTKFSASSRQPGIGVNEALHPSVAAGAAAFLVAWADGPVVDATDIRAMRITPGATSGLDPDGGLLLASTTGGAPVIAGPVAAFDGGVWLVAWTEAGVGGNDLYAVAVATDGTVLDATPRLVASGVTAVSPAIASAGDGRSLVVYVKPDGTRSAVRARLVNGQ